ncbi:MAG: hypothetical protein LCH79_15960 [Proteobacteria bacterium]|nr:hypothetical protein [Pseudomonadota bacterium]
MIKNPYFPNHSANNTTLVPLSQQPFERVNWVLPDMVALGHVTVVAGNCSHGHNAYFADLAGKVTGQSDQPVGTPAKFCQPILLWASTPHFLVTSKRLLAAAGADDRIVAVIGNCQPFDVVDDLPELLVHINRKESARIIFVEAAARPKGKEEDRCSAWRELRAACHRENVALVVSAVARRQRRKDPAGRLLDLHLADAASVVIGVSESDIEDLRARDRYSVACVKSEFGSTYGGFQLDLNWSLVEDVYMPYVHALTPLDGTPEEIFASVELPLGARVKTAVHWLRSNIPTDGMSVNEVEKRAKGDGISMASVRRAMPAAGIYTQFIARQSFWFRRQPVAGSMHSGVVPNSFSDSWSWGPQPGMPENTSGSENPFLARFSKQPHQFAQPAQPAQPAQSDTGFADPPEADSSHPDHLKFLDIVQAAIELMENSVFDETSGNPRMAVTRSVLKDQHSGWLERTDMLNGIVRRIPQPHPEQFSHRTQEARRLSDVFRESGGISTGNLNVL